jgi:hypothetical protein
MKTKFVIAAALIVASAAPAVAEEFYVVRGPDRHCTVTTTKPAENTVITEIGPLGFKTRTEAQDRIKTTKVCTDETTGSKVRIDKN